jgi:hypothetical protein
MSGRVEASRIVGEQTLELTPSRARPEKRGAESFSEARIAAFPSAEIPLFLTLYPAMDKRRSSQ